MRHYQIGRLVLVLAFNRPFQPGFWLGWERKIGRDFHLFAFSAGLSSALIAHPPRDLMMWLLYVGGPWDKEGVRPKLLLEILINKRYR